MIRAENEKLNGTYYRSLEEWINRLVDTLEMKEKRKVGKTSKVSNLVASVCDGGNLGRVMSKRWTPHQLQNVHSVQSTL